MKRVSILLLLCLAGLSVAVARPPKPTPVPLVFLNDEPLAPPDVPPQVDALMFINNSTFIVSNDFLLPPLFFTPWEAESVLIWTNTGQMVGIPGFIFDNTPNPAHMTSAQRRKKGALLSKPSSIFFNNGEITAANSLEINANHVVNPGILSGDINSRVKIEAKNGLADLTGGAIRNGDLPQPDCTSASNFIFGPFFFFGDPAVNEDYNFINFGISGVVLSNRLNTPLPLSLPTLDLNFAPPNPVAPFAQYVQSVALFPGRPATNLMTNAQFALRSCGAYDAFVHIRTNAFTNIFVGFTNASRDISVVFVPTNGYSSNVSVAVSFPTNNFFFFPGGGFFFLSDAPIVEFRSEAFDVVEQRHTTNYVTFRDDGNTVFRSRDCDFLSGEPANTPYTAGLFYTTDFSTNAVNYNYTVASVHVGNTNSPYFTNNPGSAFLFFPELGRSTAASDPTNFPGRIEITAKDLDLTQTRIRAENGVFIHATNLVGNASAFIDAPFVSLDAGTTNQNLVISNLITKQVSRPQADLNSWAANWSVNVTNGGTFVPIVTTNGVTNVFFPNIETWTYHVLILGACVNASTPSITHRFVLHGTNIVLEDSLAINASLVLEGKSLTLGKNASLTLPSRANAAFTNLQGIVNFTNSGVVNVPGGAFFGAFEDGYVQPPLKKKKKVKGPQPPRLITYESFVNHGTIDGSSVKVRTGYLEDTGAPFSPATILGSNGPVSLDGATLIISNALVQARSNVRLTAGDLLATHSTISAGATNLGVFQNLIPGALIIDVTNSLTDGGVTAGNVWRVTDGVRMVRQPKSLPADGTTGDLLGTRIESIAGTFVLAVHTWAGENRGAVPAGFTNNLALGRLVLDGVLGNQFRFKSATRSNALYIDYLELRNAATNYNFALGVDPDFTIFVGDSNIDPDKLELRSGGRVRWVSDFAGPQSSTNLTYPFNGLTYAFNAALARSQALDSDNDGQLNFQDCTPFIPPGEEQNSNLWFGAQCPLASPIHAARASVAGHQDLNLNIAFASGGRHVLLSWDAAANSANTVEFTESLSSGTWQVLTNFVNGPAAARMTVKDAADAPQRVYRIRVDAGQP